MLEGIKINFEFDQKSLPPKCKFRTGKNLFKEFALLTENIFSTRQDRDSISLPRERFALRLTVSYHFRKPVKKIVSQIQRKEINFTLMESTEKFKENLLTGGREKRYHEERERSNFETRVIQKASTSSLPFTRLEWRGRWIGFLEEGKRVHREFIASSYACPTSVSTSAERGERERDLLCKCPICTGYASSGCRHASLTPSPVSLSCSFSFPILPRLSKHFSNNLSLDLIHIHIITIVHNYFEQHANYFFQTV